MKLVLLSSIFSLFLLSKSTNVEEKVKSRVFIIAAHNENLDWLEPIASEAIIYNKGAPLANERLAGKFQDVRTLPNVGRESHTYLQYIIDNYGELPDIVTFSQGRIEDHGHKKPLEFLLRLANEAELYGGSKNFAYQYVPERFNVHTIRADVNYRSVQFREDITMEQFCKRYFGFFPRPIKVFFNGLFSVSKEKILNRPKEFYEKLLKSLDYHNNPLEGHYFERSWNMIFNIA